MIIKLILGLVYDTNTKEGKTAYFLPTWSRVLPQNLVVAQRIKKSPALYVTQSFISIQREVILLRDTHFVIFTHTSTIISAVKFT